VVDPLLPHEEARSPRLLSKTNVKIHFFIAFMSFHFCLILWGSTAKTAPTLLVLLLL
jgi:hypothetical protein